MRVIALVPALGLLLACSESQGEPSAAQGSDAQAEATVDESGSDEELAVTSDGYGRLHIGMTREEVVAAYGASNEPTASGLDPDLCDEFHPARAPDGLYVMLEENILTRITLFETRDVGTDRGILVGDPASKVRETYGDRVEAMPHTYLDPPAQYLDIWEGERAEGPSGNDPDARGIRYETNEEGNVQAIHAGGQSIQYVEGCV